MPRVPSKAPAGTEAIQPIAGIAVARPVAETEARKNIEVKCKTINWVGRTPPLRETMVEVKQAERLQRLGYLTIIDKGYAPETPSATLSVTTGAEFGAPNDAGLPGASVAGREDAEDGGPDGSE